MSRGLDTTPEAHEVQIRLLAQASVAGRLARALALSEAARRLSLRALRRRRPDLGEQEILLWWVEIHYGADLGERLRSFLAERSM